jgi:hypothetical protein
VFSLPVHDLAALVDIELETARPPVDTAIRQVAELLWDMRHLVLVGCILSMRSSGQSFDRLAYRDCRERSRTT